MDENPLVSFYLSCAAFHYFRNGKKFVIYLHKTIFYSKIMTKIVTKRKKTHEIVLTGLDDSVVLVPSQFHAVRFVVFRHGQPYSDEIYTN